MIQLFVYTRLERFDYRLLYAPSILNLPEPMRGEFINFAREVVNTDYFGEIKQPRFAIIKRKDLCLVGIGCYNRLLGNYISAIETRTIRGFFGVVIKECTKEQLINILDISFYKKIYCAYISNLWSTSLNDEHAINCKEQYVEIPLNITEIVPSSLELNTRIDVCKVYEETIDYKSIFVKALNSPCIDIVTNLNGIKHVKSAPLYKFHNITIVGENTTYTLELIPKEEKKEEKNQNKKVVQHSNQEQDKRSFQSFPVSIKGKVKDCLFSIGSKVKEKLPLRESKSIKNNNRKQKTDKNANIVEREKCTSISIDKESPLCDGDNLVIMDIQKRYKQDSEQNSDKIQNSCEGDDIEKTNKGFFIEGIDI